MKKLLKPIYFTLILTLGLVQPEFRAVAGEYSAAQSPNKNKGTKTQVIIADIMDVVGLKSNFEVRTSTDIDNAAAIVYEGKRYIIYNKDFVKVVNDLVQTDWAAVSILAHEIAHHLNGHTLIGGGSVPSEELESDEFSGFVLRRMGASLAEAQASINMFGIDNASHTHPAKTDRLQAIASGWNSADQQIMASKPAEQPQLMASAENTRKEQPAAKAESTKKDIVLSEVFLTSAPQNSYFITENLNFVKADEKGWHIIGKLAKSDEPAYEYMLHDQKSHRLFIAKNGLIMDKAGKPVGYLK